jgi:type II secretory pathway pseudopilin PulG
MIRLRSSRSLTLIELLLVLTILAALAASAASFVEEADDQLRYQDTQNRLTSLREGVLGRAAAGRAKHDGFVADLGRLPATVKELVDPGLLPAWQIDPPGLIDLATVPPTGLGYGWRGPYVPSLPRVSGERAYPDGWGNAGLSGEPADDFGWLLQLNGADLTLQSRGRDGKVGATAGDPYSADYPNGPLIQAADHALDLNGWSVRVQITAASAQTLRLRLRYFGEVAGAASQIAYLSQPLALAAGANGAQTFTFDLGATKLVPWGLKALDLVDEGGAPLTEFFGPGDGGYAAQSSVQRLELYPRASLPTDLPAGWSLP